MKYANNVAGQQVCVKNYKPEICEFLNHEKIC